MKMAQWAGSAGVPLALTTEGPALVHILKIKNCRRDAGATYVHTMFMNLPFMYIRC